MNLSYLNSNLINKKIYCCLKYYANFVFSFIFITDLGQQFWLIKSL